jgi:RNA polymerase sigma-70 factor (family 1)
LNTIDIHNEIELIAGFRAGQEAAFRQVYGQVYQPLYWYGWKYVQEEAEIEDIIAEAWLQAWKHREHFEALDHVRSFLYVAVRNQCLNLIKRRQLKANKYAEILHLLEAQEPPDFYVEQLRIDLLQKIFQEVDQLPGKMKTIFLMSYQEGLKPAVIAELLQVSAKTVSNQKLNAIRLLKLALDKQPLLLALLVLLELELVATS